MNIHSDLMHRFLYGNLQYQMVQLHFSFRRGTEWNFVEVCGIVTLLTFRCQVPCADI